MTGPIDTTTEAAAVALPEATPRKELAKKLALLEVDAEPKAEEKPEPILTPNTKRFVLFPIKHHDVSLPFCPS
jgi:hypothetical protein